MIVDTIAIRSMQDADVPEADRIFRLAFGTWLKLPDPMEFAGDSSWIATRFAGRLGAAHAAVAGDRLIGSCFIANRGSVGIVGPVTVDPAWWGRGAAQALVAAAIDDFNAWGVSHGGLYTFSDSVVHVALYRKLGFWPGSLTAIVAKELDRPTRSTDVVSFAGVEAAMRSELEREADAICDSICSGLTIIPELRCVLEQRLGDTVFVRGDRIDGFAVCHCGPGTEAGSGTCRVKFAAARSADAFAHLIDAWEQLAVSRGVPRVQAGVNFGRERASRALLARGYSALRHGVAMYRPNDPAYDRVDAWVIDDWR